MTHISKTCMLIISAALMISAWITPLQAGQNQHGEMTDGVFVIYNHVLGGGNILKTDAEGDYGIGTFGQVLTNIGSASTNADDITPLVNAGFWHAIQGTEDTLLTFKRSVTHQIEENDNSEITLGLGLNKSITNPITVTIGTSRSQSIGDSADYTIYRNGIALMTLDRNGVAQTATSFTVVIEDQEYTSLTLKVINDRDVEEADENITFSIKDIEGDDSIGVGPFSDYVVSIPANDAWPITATVRYLGSQTGNLVGFAKEMTYNDVFHSGSDWDTDTTTKTFSAKVPAGTYTICAYIDSNGEQTMVQNEWEVKGSYTWTVTINEDGTHSIGGAGNFDNIAFAMDDPDDRYESQFIAYTGTYKTWFETYPELLLPDEKGIYRDDPDDDWDQDGYSNFQEYLNGTDPTTADEAYVYNGYDPAYDIDAASVSKKYQIITTNPIVPKAEFSKSLLVDINYTTSDNNRGTTGLGLSIHYNSTFMTFAGFSNVVTETLACDETSILTPTILDENDPNAVDDNYEDTDKVINIAWVSDLEGRSWPGLEIPLPLRLCTLKFTVKSVAHSITYGDTSVIRFTATSKDTRYIFYAPPATVELDPFSFDIDGNGKANALTDGLLIMRYLFGLIVENPNHQEDAIAGDAIRKTSAEIWTYLNNGREMLDIDRNGEEDALTDALLIMRYMFGFTEGQSLIENAIGEGAVNKTDAQVVPYIKHYMPQKGSSTITPITE